MPARAAVPRERDRVDGLRTGMVEAQEVEATAAEAAPSSPPAGRPRDRDSLQQELAETVAERKAFEARLRQLRAELGLCEASREALLQKERFLRQEAAAAGQAAAAAREAAIAATAVERLDSLEDFLAHPGSRASPAAAVSSAASSPVAVTPAAAARPAAGSPGSGPVFFELEEDDDAGDAVLVEQCPDMVEADACAIAPLGQEDAEEALDYLGVARCRQCGLRLPLDVAAIEEHCKHCFLGDEVEEEDEPEEVLRGRCSLCGEELPLTADGVGRHICPANSAASKNSVVGGSPRRKGTLPVASPQRKGGLRAWWPGRSPSKREHASRSP